jgi:hypothetical protein
MIRKPYSKMKVRVYDLGLFTHLAARLAVDFGTVEYFTPWVSAFSTPELKMIGYGIPGLTRIDSFEENDDSVDLWVFFDVGNGDMQERLRRSGKVVFGCGAGEILEGNRVLFKKTLADRGLHTGKYQTVKGIDALAKMLKSETDKWIKVNNDARGVLESFHHKDWINSVSTVDEWAHKLGFLREEQIFMIEDPIHPKDGVEPGCDRAFTNKNYLSNCMYGFEAKGEGYSCIALDFNDLPKPVLEVENAMRPVYAKYDVRGMMSSELRIGPDKKPVFIDACMRAGRPPSGISSERYTNFGEMVYKVALGETVEPKYDKKKPYASEIIVHSSVSKDRQTTLPLDIKEKDLKHVKMGNICQAKQKDGSMQFFAILSNCSFMAEAIGFGETLEDSQQQAIESASKLDCIGKDFNAGVFEDLEEKLELAEKYGVGLESGKK